MAKLTAILSCLAAALLVFVSGAAAQGSEVAQTSIAWARTGATDLMAEVYRPAGTRERLPALIDVHGGAWGSGDRFQGRHYASALAENRVVVSIDFRQSPDFTHPAASADVAAAVRFVRMNADTLGVDPSRIGLIGSSSGGHLALLAALRPDAPEHKGTRVRTGSGEFGAADEVSAEVSYVVALWPVSDPAARYRYALRAGLTRLAELTRRYFPEEAAMWDASIPRLVMNGEAPRLPPLLLVQPGEDSNIPQDMTLDLMRAWQARGGRLDYAFFPDQPHAFGHTASPASAELIRLTEAFIRRQERPGR